MKRNFVKSFVRFFPFLFLLTFFIIPIFSWALIYINTSFFQGLIQPIHFKQLWLTAVIAFITAISSTIFAYPVALFWWIKRKEMVSTMILLILFVPIILGLLTRNYAWVSILSNTSFEYSFYAVVLVMLYIFIPFSFFIIIQGFSTISDNALEASKTMGASIPESFFKVIFPQTQRHLYISIFLVFSNALCYYITPAMIGGGKFDMVGNIIWKYVDKGLFNEASNISLIFISYTIPLFYAAIYFIVKRRRSFLSR